MNNSPRDLIKGSIDRVETKVKHGKLKPLRVKTRTVMSKSEPKEISTRMNDNVNKVERDEICKIARGDNNPATGAHSVKADFKRELSNKMREMRKEAGLM